MTLYYNDNQQKENPDSKPWPHPFSHEAENPPVNINILHLLIALTGRYQKKGLARLPTDIQLKSLDQSDIRFSRYRRSKNGPNPEILYLCETLVSVKKPLSFLHYNVLVKIYVGSKKKCFVEVFC
jgi:hypothetical protein